MSNTLPLSVFQPTPTASAPTPSGSLTFNTIPDTTTCSNTTVTWNLTGTLANMTIIASNFDPTDPSLPTQGDQTVTAVTARLDPNQLSFFWEPVNVAPGDYILVAIAAGMNGTAKSPHFTVSQGDDTLCVPTITIPISVPSPTSSSDQAVVPVGASGSTNSIVGPVVGGIVGGVALVIMAITAWVFYLRKKGRPARGAGGSAFSGGRGGRWNGLSSRDSGINSILPRTTGDVKPKGSGHGVTESTAGIMSGPNSALGHNREGTSPRGSEEDDLSTLAEEKSVKHTTLDHIDTIPPLPYNASRRTSVSSRTSPTSASPPPRTRSASENHALALDRLEQPSAITPPPRDRFSINRQSLDGRILSSTADFPSAASPTSPTFYPAPSELLPMGRSASTGMGRRAARKPVPTYLAGDGSSMTADSSSHGVYSDGNNSSTTGSSVDISPPSAQRSRVELPVPGTEFPVPNLNLNHKSSFGDGRPMHYLIPDMPPPPRE